MPECGRAVLDEQMLEVLLGDCKGRLLPCSLAGRSGIAGPGRGTGRLTCDFNGGYNARSHGPGRISTYRT